jgi:ubiquinone/menaquinone biosynthesis C-methylase UbiE
MDSKKCVEKYNQWAKNYDQCNEILYFKLLNEVLVEIIFSYLPKKGKILDAAGGTGRISIPLAKKGFNVTCTDLSKNMLEQCRLKIKDKKYEQNISLLELDVTNMKKLESNYFDLSICIGNCISYCDYNKALSELRRVTKKNSYLIVDMHSFYQAMRNFISKKDIRSIDKLIKTHNYYNSDYEEHCFDIEEINDVFKKNNIKIVKIFGKATLQNSDSIDNINYLLKDKKFYNYLKKKELEYNSKPELLSQALELCVVGKIL